jgi:putative membrane protein
MISFLKKNKFTLLTANIILIYLVGISGILLSKNEVERISFMQLTPLNLMMNILMLFSFHNNWNQKFVLSSIFIGIAGFFIEVLGVKTGYIFGSYNYGDSLGLKILEVPVIMALNWLLLIYATATMLSTIKNDILFSIAGATIITLLDVLIEPLCAYLHFWFWEGNVPFQNFVAWFVISCLLFYFFRKVNKNISNPYAVIIISTQFLFFGILNIYKHFV